MSVKVAFIGAGRMAEALIKGIITAGLYSPADIIATDVDSDRLAFMSKTYGIETSADNYGAAVSASIIVLCVKPQHLDVVLAVLGDMDMDRKLIISIAAGVTTGHIRSIINRPVSLVRVMPNAPALVGRGISVMAAAEELPIDDRRTASDLFSAVGEVLFLDESLINQVTAISGSGPAYFYYWARSLERAGEAIGLPADVAATLVRATFTGAAKLMDSSGTSLDDLITMVASKGGTTEAALNSFDQAAISDIITEGVESALNRAKELDIGDKTD